MHLEELSRDGFTQKIWWMCTTCKARILNCCYRWTSCAHTAHPIVNLYLLYNVEFIILEFEMKIETDIVFLKLLLLYFFRTYLSVIQNIQQGCSLCEEKSFSNLLKVISDVNSLLETSPISLCNIPKGIDDRWWMFIDFDTSLWLSKGWIMFSKFSSLKMSSGFTRVVNMTHGKWIILRFQNRKSMMIRCKKVIFLYSHSLALCWWQFRISKTQCQRPAIAH